MVVVEDEGTVVVVLWPIPGIRMERVGVLDAVITDVVVVVVVLEEELKVSVEMELEIMMLETVVLEGRVA